MFKLFAGTANLPLAQEVSQLLKVPLAQSETARFANSEIKVTIQEDVRDQICIVIQPTTNPTDTNVMELAFFADALNRQEARKVIGIVPYFGYARQDIQHRDGECVSANVIIRLIEAVGYYQIITVDLHDEATGGVFRIPFKNISALPIVAERIKKDFSAVSVDDVALVSPDQSGTERVRNFGEMFFGTDNFDLAVVEKKRNLNAVHKSLALDIHGEVKNKLVILIDDIATSAGTVMHAAELCKERGAKKIIAAITHHDFSPEAPQLIQNSAIEEFYTTNSIQLREDQKFPKLKEISIAPLLAETIRKSI